MTPEEAVLNFRTFLNVSWVAMEAISRTLDWDESPYFIDEWLQANWELLVEMRMEPVVTLLPYGYNDSPDARYTRQGENATHRIICVQKDSDHNNKHRFLMFVSKEGKSVGIMPPFDMVSVENEETRERLHLPLESVVFSIESLR